MSDFMLSFCKGGKVSCVVGGQWGSCGKGAAVAWMAYELAKQGRSFDIVTANNGSQSGHTSIHKGKKRVLFHLPTAPFIARDELGHHKAGAIYLNAGSVIDPKVLEKELTDNQWNGLFFIHPMAAVITDECKAEENKSDSSTTKIASTRKGVGAALARKVMRSGMVANDHPFLRQFVRKLDLTSRMIYGKSVLVEVPQGVSLSLNQSRFYPYTTSRDCTPAAGLSDAGIHPSFYGETMVVLRTYPIRVGAITEKGKTLGTSGDFYPDQKETSWDELGVEAEITTVTKRVRRVFTFSVQQLLETFVLCRPNVVMLTFTNYMKERAALDRIVTDIHDVAKMVRMPPPKMLYEHGPTTADVGETL